MAFGDSATGTTVDISTADVSPTGMVFCNSTENFTVQGSKAVTGSGGLTKVGAGTLTINNTNSFTGGVAVNGGNVVVGSIANGGVNGALGAGTSLSFDGGTLSYTGATAVPNRAITLNEYGGMLEVASGGQTLTLAGTISGTGTSARPAHGKLVLATREQLLRRINRH